MTNFGGVSGDQLKQYIERIESLEAEKQDIADNIKDAFAEAKGNGFDVKVMRQIIKLRKLEASERDEQDAVLDLYKHALGMLPDFEPRNNTESSISDELLADESTTDEIENNNDSSIAA